MAKYPYLRVVGTASINGVNPKLLSTLDDIGRNMGKVITVQSGYRSPAYSASVGGYPNDPHSRGEAVDAYVDGRPIGDVVSLATFSRLGLQGGNQPDFYNGKSDPEHVQIPGSGNDKSMMSPILKQATGVTGTGNAPPSDLQNGANTQFSDVPKPLMNVIDTAASKYNLDPGVLAGIWRVETGRHFPNPYVNKEGYGGLFGTHNWNDPIQSQADTAASILSNLIHTKGSLPAALMSYSGGGYSSVPGFSGPASLVSTPSPTSSPTQTTPQAQTTKPPVDDTQKIVSMILGMGGPKMTNVLPNLNLPQPNVSAGLAPTNFSPFLPSQPTNNPLLPQPIRLPL